MQHPTLLSEFSGSRIYQRIEKSFKKAVESFPETGGGKEGEDGDPIRRGHSGRSQEEGRTVVKEQRGTETTGDFQSACNTLTRRQQHDREHGLLCGENRPRGNQTRSLYKQEDVLLQLCFCICSIIKRVLHVCNR